ncbi:hypothetical protein SCLCIDRAFT_21307 [Scleroderma citrinum Foug A]|uniref:Uncharacterized protein n=1 Tax=Scleroderma citrinum Foug A TaxID=1036808 RepID=A0A0C3A181_9AGAM|nr:hypothetical protein SCLCIDRAFT_21307 [Scleroderma citrinum Foug A]
MTSGLTDTVPGSNESLALTSYQFQPYPSPSCLRHSNACLDVTMDTGDVSDVAIWISHTVQTK